MSHSQFHSTKLFILRHAWLNLWDKRMTTGRINQVNIFAHKRWMHCSNQQLERTHANDKRSRNTKSRPHPPNKHTFTCRSRNDHFRNERYYTIEIRTHAAKTPRNDHHSTDTRTQISHRARATRATLSNFILQNWISSPREQYARLPPHTTRIRTAHQQTPDADKHTKSHTEASTNRRETVLMTLRAHVTKRNKAQQHSATQNISKRNCNLMQSIRIQSQSTWRTTLLPKLSENNTASH